MLTTGQGVTKFVPQVGGSFFGDMVRAQYKLQYAQ